MPVTNALRTCSGSLIAANDHAIMSKTVHALRAQANSAKARAILLDRYPLGLVGVEEIDAVLSLYFSHEKSGHPTGQHAEDLPV